MPKRYEPPFTLTSAVLDRVAAICELLGRWQARSGGASSPQLRRVHRIRSVQASLAIEANTLSIEQVTAVLDGKPVLAPPREVQEVRNAFAAYEQLPQWRADSADDLRAAHACLMAGLMEAPGAWRRGGVGIYRGKRLVHMAPPASRVSALMTQLLGWVARTDGNGRLGRLWQTLMLSRWQPVLAWLPVESVIRDQQDAYYAALAASDAASTATPFVEFMLGALGAALEQAIATDLATDQADDQVTDQVPVPVTRLLKALRRGESLSARELMERLGLRHLPSFRQQYLRPALAGGWLEMSRPDAPRSPSQTYRRAAMAPTRLR